MYACVRACAPFEVCTPTVSARLAREEGRRNHGRPNTSLLIHDICALSTPLHWALREPATRKVAIRGVRGTAVAWHSRSAYHQRTLTGKRNA